MALILLLLAAIVVGYYLSRTRYSKNIDEATGRVSKTSRSWTDRAEGWWQNQFRRGSQIQSFSSWAAQSDELPDDFKEWLAGLSPEEEDEFTKSLDEYATGLGYNLVELVDGSLDDRPALVQAFVEAIVIYSQEYRKAMKARQDAESESNNGDQAEPVEEKKPAEKRKSRRKQDTSEAAA
jgi:hypothetical protein